MAKKTTKTKGPPAASPPVPGYDPMEEGVTQSMLSLWASCREASRMALNGLQIPGKRSRYIEYGNLWHALFDAHYRSLRAGDGPLKKDAMTAVIEDWEHRNEQTPALDAEAFGDIQRDAALASVLFPVYAVHYRKDEQLVWEQVEQTFDLRWEGYRLRGKRDGAFRLPSLRKGGKGSLWLFETKTKSQVSERTIGDVLAFDFQLQLYTLTLEEETGESVAGAVYNVVRTPGLKQGKTETLQEYVLRVAKDVSERPDHYFMRWEVPNDSDAKARFRRDLLTKLREFASWASGAGPHYRNERACAHFGACPYLQACSAGNIEGYVALGRRFSELEAEEE